MSNLSVKLRELRGSTSQAEMASMIGIPQQAWARYEKGIVSPNAETLEKICRVHACSADWLLGLREHGTGAVTVKGNGNAVANGSHAIAISGSPVAQPGASALCRKCPYKKLGEKMKREISGI